MRAWLWAILTMTAVLLIILAGSWLRNARIEEAAVTVRLAEAVGLALPAAAPAAAPMRDFTASLGPVRPAEQLVEEVQQAAAGAGVALIALQVSEQAPRADRLGRTELPIELQGPYPAVKHCLAEILRRIPQSTVARLQWQRVEGTPDTVARAQLVVWFAPTVAKASAGT